MVSARPIVRLFLLLLLFPTMCAALRAALSSTPWRNTIDTLETTIVSGLSILKLLSKGLRCTNLAPHLSVLVFLVQKALRLLKEKRPRRLWWPSLRSTGPTSLALGLALCSPLIGECSEAAAMDLGLGPLPPTPQGGPPRRGQRSPSPRGFGGAAPQGSEEAEAAASSAQMQKLMVLLSKMALAAELQGRVMMSILLDVLLISCSHAAPVAMKVATQAYGAKAKLLDARGRMALGLPHIHAWNALLGVAGTKGPPELQALVKEYLAPFGAQGVDSKAMFQNEVKYVRVGDCFVKSKFKIQAAFLHGSSSRAIWMHLKAWMINGGAEEKQGMPPQGNLARQVQAILDALKEASGDGA